MAQEHFCAGIRGSAVPQIRHQVDARDPAVVGHRAKVTVFLVARMIVDRSTAGVRNKDRLVFGGGGGDPIRGRTAATVTEVQRDSKTDHPMDGLAAQAAQSRVTGLEAAVSQKVSYVICRLN